MNALRNLFPENEEPDSDTNRKKDEGRPSMANVPHDSSSRSGAAKDNSNTPGKSSTKDAADAMATETGKKSDDKPRGLFSWFGNWRKNDK